MWESDDSTRVCSKDRQEGQGGVEISSICRQAAVNQEASDMSVRIQSTMRFEGATAGNPLEARLLPEKHSRKATSCDDDTMVIPWLLLLLSTSSGGAAKDRTGHAISKEIAKQNLIDLSQPDAANPRTPSSRRSES